MRKPINTARQKDSLYTGIRKAIDRIRSIAFKLSNYARRMILLGWLTGFEPATLRATV